MTRMHAKAPTLAWLLTALTCLLTGLAVTETRRQELEWPAPPAGVVVTIEDAFTPTPTPIPEPTPLPTPTLPAPPPMGQPGDAGNPR